MDNILLIFLGKEKKKSSHLALLCDAVSVFFFSTLYYHMMKPELCLMYMYVLCSLIPQHEETECFKEISF